MFFINSCSVIYSYLCVQCCFFAHCTCTCFNGYCIIYNRWPTLMGVYMPFLSCLVAFINYLCLVNFDQLVIVFGCVYLFGRIKFLLLLWTKSKYRSCCNSVARASSQKGQGRENWGSNDPREIYLGVKPGILTPDFLERNISGIQLILSKIIKRVAISCQILWLKCTKLDFGLGSIPVPAGRAYSAPPDLLAPSRSVALMILTHQSKNSSHVARA